MGRGGQPLGAGSALLGCTHSVRTHLLQLGDPVSPESLNNNPECESKQQSYPTVVGEQNCQRQQTVDFQNGRPLKGDCRGVTCAAAPERMGCLGSAQVRSQAAL